MLVKFVQAKTYDIAPLTMAERVPFPLAKVQTYGLHICRHAAPRNLAMPH